MGQLVVACADIGSMKNTTSNFGWHSSAGVEGCYASELVAHLAGLLGQGLPVALGFECPLFVPLRSDERALTNQRAGEDGKPWSAGAGCGAIGTGLVQVAWIFRQLRDRLSGVPAFSLTWSEFQQASGGLFFWEAFVTGTGKRDGHVADARSAVEAFQAALPNVDAANALPNDGDVLSLLGAALIRAGWTKDVSVLSQQLVVIRTSAQV
ncbi:hypothetical protein [Aquimonas sp.]|jgi:hypothetical protein|uniref:hypothetical protein n=1 Tax=Aquimonas sp. TaxID=1872588 RepID=UPI0037BE979E